jgi:hypothetical protein
VVTERSKGLYWVQLLPNEFAKHGETRIAQHIGQGLWKLIGTQFTWYDNELTVLSPLLDLDGEKRLIDRVAELEAKSKENKDG